MPNNIITSEDVAPKKIKQPKIKKVEQDVIPDEENIIVYFESGASYALLNGLTFTKEKRMFSLPIDEAKRLLSLDNFRLPNDEEKQVYYNGLEV